MWDDPWCNLCDFNVVRFQKECNKGNRLSSVMRRFLKMIEELKRRDLPLLGAQVRGTELSVLIEIIPVFGG